MPLKKTNNLEESLWVDWKEAINTILFYHPINPIVLISVSLSFTYFIVQRPDFLINDFALGAMGFLVSLIVYPFIISNRHSNDLNEIFRRYLSLAYSFLRLIYVSFIFLIPCLFVYLFFKSTEAGEVNDGILIATLFPSFLLFFLGLFVSLPLDYERILNRTKDDIYLRPQAFFKGFWPAFRDSVIIRICFQLPLLFLENLLIGLVSSPAILVGLLFLIMTANILMTFSILIVIIEREA